MIVSSYAELISWMYSCVFIRMSVLQLGQNNTQMVAHIMPQDRQSLAADLYLFNFVFAWIEAAFHEDCCIALSPVYSHIPESR